MSAATSVSRAGQPRPALDDVDSHLLDALLAKGPAGIAFLDSAARVRRASQSFADMIGVKLDEQIGHPVSQVWPADLAARAQHEIGQALAVVPLQADPGYDGPGEIAVPGARPAAEGLDLLAGHREGSQLALSWHRAYDVGGALAGVTLVAIEVTAEVEAAELVRRTSERYSSLVQAGNQVVWITDPSGQVTEDAPEWRWITGQSADQYLAAGWLAAVHPDDAERTRQEWLECVHAGTVFDGSYRVRTKTGSYRHYDVRAVPIERDGVIVEWMGACSDVTGQREADEMRGRLTEQLSAAALRTSRLQQATSMLAKELSVMQVVTIIADVGQSAIGADRSAVGIVQPDRLRLRILSSEAMSDGTLGELSGEIPLDVPSVLTAAIALRRTLVLDGPEALRRQFESEGGVELFLRHSDERAWVGLPLITSGEPLGALQFTFTAPRQITDEDRVFLEALAGQCALALERAMLYEREHTTAETLQRSLLPDCLPDVPGITLRAFYRPVSIEVGGDWYDAFRLPDGKLAVAAGDVMGKGLTAAAGMGRVRNALRALALTDPRPAAVLAGLDRLFLATEGNEQVTTVCYLVVDPRTGDGVAGNAGHLPPLLLTPGMAPRLDQAEPGTPLGWASPRQQYPFSLPAGSTAVLYSDGLVENRKRGLDIGLEELVAVAGRAPAHVRDDPDALIAFLFEQMLKGHEQDDDVTVLALRMSPNPVVRVRDARARPRG